MSSFHAGGFARKFTPDHRWIPCYWLHGQPHGDWEREPWEGKQRKWLRYFSVFTCLHTFFSVGFGFCCSQGFFVLRIPNPLFLFSHGEVVPTSNQMTKDKVDHCASRRPFDEPHGARKWSLVYGLARYKVEKCRRAVQSGLLMFVCYDSIIWSYNTVYCLLILYMIYCRSRTDVSLALIVGY